MVIRLVNSKYILYVLNHMWLHNNKYFILYYTVHGILTSTRWRVQKETVKKYEITNIYSIK